MMKLLNDAIEKAREAKQLLEVNSRDEAERALYEAETLLDQLPAAVEDWAHMMLGISQLCVDVRESLHRDVPRCIEDLEQVIAKLEEVNAAAQSYGVQPEDPEDVSLE